ncbi:hypothetical protein EUX98_g8449 [Antrodiella citrinella]|uniref:Uncharacterized protein n=1 Tax=Antrodiella citrinella TaxID=2447956 RepID=A0A4S4M775_9APHY|nr:hypothetical protein EUX98_g8449 [Antrodiella citrinella]
MEKGTYRIRPPRSRAPSLLGSGTHTTPSGRSRSLPLSSDATSDLVERNLFAIVLLLIFGVVFCFAAAYHLFQSRVRL